MIDTIEPEDSQQDDVSNLTSLIYEIIGLGVAYSMTTDFEYPEKLPGLGAFGERMPKLKGLLTRKVDVLSSSERLYGVHLKVINLVRQDYLASLPDSVNEEEQTLVQRIMRKLKKKKQPLTTEEIRDKYFEGMTSRIEKQDLEQYFTESSGLLKILRNKNLQFAAKLGLTKWLKSNSVQGGDFTGNLLNIVFTYINTHPDELDQLIGDCQQGGSVLVERLYEQWGPQ